MKRYGIFASLLLLCGITATAAQASSTELDINLGCVAVATRDVSIKTGDCGVRRVERVERVERVKVVRVENESPHYHHVHGKNHPGKGKGKGNQEDYVVLVPADKHGH